MSRPYSDVIVLDLECAHSPDDCRYCGKAQAAHMPGVMVCQPEDAFTLDHRQSYTPLGWNNKPALGLSIGCYWSYARQRLVWFDTPSLEDTVRALVASEPYIVSFNGIGFDFVVMRGLLRRQAEVLFNTGDPQQQAQAAELHALCDLFKLQVARSYDLLATIWESDPAGKRVRGVNGLDVLCQANGFGGKQGDSAAIPRTWQEGHVAHVVNHCGDDVLLTRDLFELVIAQGYLERIGAPRVTLPRPPQEVLQPWRLARPEVEEVPSA